MKRTVAAVVLIVCSITTGVSTVRAEPDSDPFTEFPRAFGVVAGAGVADGLAWLYWPGALGLQATVSFFYSSEGTAPFSNRELDYEVGGMGMRRLYSETFADWIAGQLYLWGSGRQFGYTLPEEDFVAGVGAGIGFGIELLIYRHISIPFEVGYNSNSEFTGEDPQALEIQLGAQGGIRYRY